MLCRSRDYYYPPLKIVVVKWWERIKLIVKVGVKSDDKKVPDKELNCYFELDKKTLKNE